MAVELFAGVPVNDFAAVLGWYERLFGKAPAFFAHETEAVWEFGEHRYVYIVERAGRAGQAVMLLFVDDLDGTVAGIAERGLAPAETETYGDGVRKITYRDADGNEISFGGAPA